MIKSRKVLLENRLEEINGHVKKYGKSYQNSSEELMLPGKKGALMNVSNVHVFESEISQCNEIINVFESAFEKLDPLTYQVIDMKYIKMMNWEDVGYDINYCIRSCNKLANDGLKKIEQMIGDIYES